SNGGQISYYHRKDPNYFEPIPHIPKATEKLTDVLTERWHMKDLIENDILIKEKKSLKGIIEEMEDEVLANAGVDVFEEVFKLIFTKLFDEMESGRNDSRPLKFRNYGETETELKLKIQELFDESKKKWEGVFTDDSKIMLTPSHLSVCVSSLQGLKLFNSNLDVVDEAFEYLINKSSKGEKGQYFTPRYAIDMCVKMLNPQEHETMIDTASGSCGFPVHTIFKVWRDILKDEGKEESHLFTTEKKGGRYEDYVVNKIFAIDFDEKAVRVSRTLNLIAGDGQSNVLHLNTLDYERWDDKVKEDEDWQDVYFEGWKKLKKLRRGNDNREFGFDVLMANPPFAGDIKESRILAKYELGKKPNGKYQTKVGRDILFIERNLDFLKPGGRMAVVLPQGRFNNSSDKNIRDYIAEHCRILAVVGLHGNVFKPHTGTKTSVLFVQKWDEELCPKVDDYPIFFATMQEPSKDNSGEKIFVKKKDIPEALRETVTVADTPSILQDPAETYTQPDSYLDEYVLDSHGHLMVKHDLYNHDGLTQDGIAEAFLEFAKKEKLSFVGKP
ncbi:N-6 DNA methylase, partial [Fulvivirga sp.]